ncbi:RICIN domain-containing protein [Xiashengella succiniciproducens]|uniref:RICIN domain-containing protein n=1 Tax=Xiashengella succiniciproducens TaxID=2949635 RepID=A0A9J6ZNP2_9BACT|nr:RICIN domain-containing protein [Alkaliflexus sp. Ai-910]URW79127.1 RICIN domain-containing protein [Alkaliflexus sp. Ai-910]
MKRNLRGILIPLLLLLPGVLMAWPGMETPTLKVEGRYLKDPCGNIINLHGVGITVSPWFNGCMFGSQYCRWDNYNVTGALNYNKAIIDRLTNTGDGWFINYIRLHIDPYWTNTPGAAIPENNISRFNFQRLVTYTDQVIVPLINHARSRGCYVVLRPPGVCPDRIAVNDAYHQYLMQVWGYLSKHPSIKNANNVMFEIANEPIEILGTNGVWGSTGQAHFQALKNFFQPIVNMIRNNGANNICWIPGTGWQSHYAGYATYPITGGNIGYAVHIYPGYWGGVHNYQAFKSAWDINVKPAADIAPIIITETDWAPQSYKDAGHYVWGISTTGVAGGNGFGANLKYITDQSGNVSWNVLAPENLLHMGDPNGGTAYGNNWEACAAPVKQWFSQYAASTLPTGNCSQPGGCSGTNNLPDGIYTITARHSSKNLDVYNLSTQAGGNIVQWSPTGHQNQQWIVTKSNGYFSIRSIYSDKCLDVENWGTHDGANIQQWDCNGMEVQQFCVQDAGNGYYSIINRNSGKCVDITNVSTADGANVQQYTCNGCTCQQFRFTPVASNSISEGTYTLINRHSGQALDASGKGTTQGTNVAQWAANGQTNQQWIFTSTGDGYFRISPAHAPSLGLDVVEASTANGANIQLWSYWGADCQKWKITESDGGYYKIEAKHSGQLIEVVGASTQNGANVQQWPNNNHYCQQWALQKLKSASLESGIDDEECYDESSLTLLTNRSDGSFTLEADNLEGITKVMVYDMQGRLLFARSYTKPNRIEVNANLQGGLYIVAVVNGEKRASFKLDLR